MDTPANASVEPRLLKHQMEILAGNMAGIVIGSISLAIGAAAMLIDAGAPHTTVYWWLASLIAIMALRAGSFYWFRRYGITVENARRWAIWATVFSAAVGSTWGSLGLLFFDTQEPLRLAIVAIVLSGMMASATNSTGAYWPATLAFSVMCTTAFNVQCLLNESPGVRIMGVLGIIYFGFTAGYARSIAHTVRDSLLLRFENQELLDSLQQAKEKAETANQNKTRLLAAASHDLRQPMHALSLSLPVLRQAVAPWPGASTALQAVTSRMQSALDSMEKLLHLLLDVSRLDSGALEPKLKPCSLNATMTTAVDQARAHADSKDLTIRLVERDHWVMCDEVMLQSIVSNLVQNAVRYTDKGGVLVGTRLRGDRVVIQVWDTGRGIPAEDVPRLCDEFFQASNAGRQHHQTRGFGLGLAIVHRMTSLNGGQLSIRSKLGRGSCFSVSLPAAAAIPQQESQIPVISTAPHPRTLLVVDNDAQILATINDLLTAWGHRAIAASSMDEALSKVNQHADAIDLAVIDYHLDAETSGLDVVRSLRRLVKPTVPLVILTGDTSPDIVRQAQEWDVRLIYKPVNPTQLQGIIESVA